jgi:hypothetical protein
VSNDRAEMWASRITFAIDAGDEDVLDATLDELIICANCTKRTIIIAGQKSGVHPR